MTDKDYLTQLRIPTIDNPLRIILSACLIGTLCGADGSSYGDYPNIKKIANLPTVKVTSFCPENFVFGTPREIPDILNGTGADVLDGKAKVINESGEDISKEMIRASKKMLQLARTNEIELAIMMDVSAACGSQVIYKGHRLSKSSTYQIGKGVCAELLHRNGFKVISQRDYGSLEILMTKIDTQHKFDNSAIDHNQTEWYKEYFRN